VSNRLIVTAPEPKDFTVTIEQFRTASEHWLPHAIVGGGISDDGPVDASILVERPGEPRFRIFHFQNEDMLSTDGTQEQAAEVAVWAVDSFPKTGDGELWMVDQGYNGHTVLTPGMSISDVWANWQDHT
jgi:hypothetical protein